MRVVRLSLLLAAVTVALAVPVAVLAGASGQGQTAPAFVFGRTGGNIIPAKVTIGRDGRVTATGGMRATLTQASLPLRNGLAKLARAEGFWTEATSLACGKINPDVASRFITVSQGGKARTVTARGTCYPAFEELYAVLSAAFGVSG